MRARYAAAVAAMAALACVAVAVSPVGLPGGAATVPRCGADELPQRVRQDTGLSCLVEEDDFEEECSDWCYALFADNSILVCNAVSNRAPCCAHYVFDDLSDKLTYARTMPYSVTDRNTATGRCIDLTLDDRCAECADGFTEEGKLSCNSFDVPAYTVTFEGRGQCSVSDEASTNRSPSSPGDDADEADDTDDGGDSNGGGGGVPVAAIAGGAVGAVVIVAAVPALLLWCCCRGPGKSAKPRSSADTDDDDGAIVAAAAARLRAEAGRDSMLDGSDVGAMGSGHFATQASYIGQLSNGSGGGLYSEDGYGQPGEHGQTTQYAQPMQHAQPMQYAQPAQYAQPKAGDVWDTGAGAFEDAGAATVAHAGEYTAGMAADKHVVYTPSSPQQPPLPPPPPPPPSLPPSIWQVALPDSSAPLEMPK